MVRIPAREITSSPKTHSPLIIWCLVLSRRQRARVVLVFTHLQFVTGLRSGDMPLQHLCVITGSTGDNFSFGWDYSWLFAALTVLCLVAATAPVYLMPCNLVYTRIIDQILSPRCGDNMLNTYCRKPRGIISKNIAKFTVLLYLFPW
jgi:hypothetical protein